MHDLTYENRIMKKGDTIELISGIKMDQEIEDFYIDATVLSEIKKMASIMYVTEMSSDKLFCKVQTQKGTRGRKFERFYPGSLFKIVKAPKMGDIVNWLYDNQLISYPIHWMPFKKDISGIVRYIPKIFQKNLKAIYLVNKTCNHLYNNDDPFEILMYYKTIIQKMGLTFYGRYNEFNAMSKRKSFIDTVLSLNREWHTIEAVSLYEMNKLNVFRDDLYISNEERLDIYKNPKKAVQKKGDDYDILKKEIEEIQSQVFQAARDKDTRFLKELNQDIIDKLELTIFNVKTLPNTNQILFIFIDKDNNKKFYVQPFNFTFYVSNKGGIIENDYITPFDATTHIPFIIRDFDVLRNLKFAVNDNHKRFMKKGGF